MRPQMAMTRPRVEGDHINIAENQHQYLQLSAVRVQHPQGNGVLLAFQPDQDELDQLNKGEAIYIALLTFGAPMNPITVTAGRDQAAQNFGLEVEK